MKTKRYIAILVGMLLLAGCSNEDKKVQFKLDSNLIEIGPEGGTREIKVSSNGYWIATTDAAWITISPANGRGSTTCKILIDSALTEQVRNTTVRIQNQETWENQEIEINQDGFDYAITLKEEDQTVSIPNYADYDNRYFDVKIKTNVNFRIEIPDNANWLSNERYDVTLPRGIRPREVKVRFNWKINSKPMENIADIKFIPTSKEGDDLGESFILAQNDILTVTQKAAEPIVEDTRQGDSVALLGIARTLGVLFGWDDSKAMNYWDGISLWEDGPNEGRVRSAKFFLFDTKEGIPYEVQYLTAAEELYFYGNTNSQQRDLSPGEYISQLGGDNGNLKRLTIAAYGLSSLEDDFTELKNLEYLDLSSNNFQKIPELITKEHFPKLRALLLNSNQRSLIYDLSNNTRTNFGGFYENTTDDLKPLLLWNLDTLELSVNYFQGALPTFENDPDVELYDEEDVAASYDPKKDRDTLPNFPAEGRTIIGTPKIMPNTKRFTINLNRLTGRLPDWLLRHPALNWWDPFTMVFNQEGIDEQGNTAGFENTPTNWDSYYEFYKDCKDRNHVEEEEETISGTQY